MKRVFIFLAEGFEEIEALTAVDVLRRANIQCDMVSMGADYVTGSHGITVKADLRYDDWKAEAYVGLLLPGGMPGARHLKEDLRVIAAVKEFYNDGRLVASLCAAPIVFAEAGILKGRKATSFPSFKVELGECEYCEELVVADRNIITSRGPATALYFSFAVVAYLAGEEAADRLKEGMLINFVEGKIRENL